MILKKNTKEYQIYLEMVRSIFEKKANKKFSTDELEVMALRLARLGVVFHNYFSKQKGKEPLFEL